MHSRADSSQNLAVLDVSVQTRSTEIELSSECPGCRPESVPVGSGTFSAPQSAVALNLCNGGVGYCLVFAGGFDCGDKVMLKAGFGHIPTNSRLRREEVKSPGIVLSHD